VGTTAATVIAKTSKRRWMSRAKMTAAKSATMHAKQKAMTTTLIIKTAQTITKMPAKTAKDRPAALANSSLIMTMVITA